MQQITIPPELCVKLSDHGRAALDSLRSVSGADAPTASDIARLSGLSDWDTVLLLARAEVLGSDELRKFVDATVGPGPCCVACKDKDTAEKRGRTRSALNLLARRLRQGGDACHPVNAHTMASQLRQMVAGANPDTRSQIENR